MKISVVHSPPHGEVPFRNIGLIYLQTVLLEKGYDVNYFDISFIEDRDKKDFYDKIIRYLSKKVGRVGDMPDLELLLGVAFPEDFESRGELTSVITDKVNKYFNLIKDRADVFIFSNNVLTMYFSCALAKRLRDYGKITIGGGPTTHFIPFTRFTLLSGIYDYVVVGEGEEVIIPLLDSIDKKKKIKKAGIYYCSEGEVYGKGKAFKSSISEPSLLNFRNIAINDFIPVLAGRGCLHKCKFCSEPHYWPKYRVRPYMDVINEMNFQYKEYNINNFHFHDDSINANLMWFDCFINQLIKNSEAYQWESFCTPFGLNEKRIEKMKESGCVLLKMGVQSFSENVLKLMGRPTNVKAVIKTIKDCIKYDISMHFDLLTCFPGEREEDHKVNLQILEELYNISDKIYFSPNPFYLSIGSDTMINYEKYGIGITYYDINSMPIKSRRLKEVLKKSGNFPELLIQVIDEKEIRKRVDDYHKLLIRYNKDYLFLGRA